MRSANPTAPGQVSTPMVRVRRLRKLSATALGV
jgi:hypothetical protein